MEQVDGPAINALEVSATTGSSYPSPFHEPCIARLYRNLGDQFGLSDFGVNLTILEPGAWSSQRHWHTHEDEFIYILEGQPTLVTDKGESLLGPGSIAGFRANSGNGHHLVNNTDAPVQLLVVGSRKTEDDVYYSDIDMQILHGSSFEHKNGEPY